MNFKTLCLIFLPLFGFAQTEVFIHPTQVGLFGAANNSILSANTGTGVAEWTAAATWLTAVGAVTGTGTANQIAYWGSTTSITGHPNLTFTGTNTVTMGQLTSGIGLNLFNNSSQTGYANSMNEEVIRLRNGVNSNNVWSGISAYSYSNNIEAAIAFQHVNQSSNYGDIALYNRGPSGFSENARFANDKSVTFSGLANSGQRVVTANGSGKLIAYTAPDDRVPFWRTNQLQEDPYLSFSTSRKLSVGDYSYASGLSVLGSSSVYATGTFNSGGNYNAHGITGSFNLTGSNINANGINTYLDISGNSGLSNNYVTGNRAFVAVNSPVALQYASGSNMNVYNYSPNVPVIFGLAGGINENATGVSLSNRVGIAFDVDKTWNSTAHDGIGIQARVRDFSAAGRWSSGVGINGQVQECQTGYGIQAFTSNTKGTGNTATGIYVLNSVSNPSVIVDNATGIELLATQNSSGVITNYTAIRAVTWPTGTNNYFIYSNGASAKSYHAGFFGLNVGSPTQQLDVDGGARFRGAIYDNANSPGVSGYVPVSTGTGWAWGAGTSLFPAGTNGQTIRHNGTTWVANSFLYNNGTGVAIDISTPYPKFHVSKGDIGVYKTGGASLFLGDLNYENSGYWDKPPGLTALYNGSVGVASDLGLYTYNGSRNLRAILDYTGRFGINEAAPQYKLDVNGDFRLVTRTGTATAVAGWTTGNVSADITVGTGLSLIGGVLSNAGDTNANNDVNNIQDDGVPMTQRQTLNLVSTSTINMALTDNAGLGTTEIRANIPTGAVGATELASSGVTAATYGSSTLVPVVTIDQDGRVTSATTAAVTATNIYNTSDALTGNRTMTMADYSLTFSKTAASSTPTSALIVNGANEASFSNRFFEYQDNGTMRFRMTGNSALVSMVSTTRPVELQGSTYSRISASAAYIQAESGGGIAINNVSSDPSSPANGTFWYNSTSHLYKDRVNSATRTRAYVETDFTGNAVSIRTANHTPSGLDYSLIYDANAGGFTVTLGSGLKDGYDYTVKCRRNGTNTITFSAEAGYVFEIDQISTIAPTSIVMGGGGTGIQAPHKVYTVRRAGTNIFIQ